MNQKTISTNNSCFLIKDSSLKDDFNSQIYTWLQQEGFVPWGKKGTYCMEWIYINIHSKIFAPGIPGIKVTDVVCNHAITFDEFLTIYEIFNKYSDFSVLQMPQGMPTKLR